jgi:hypothetical protein
VISCRHLSICSCQEDGRLVYREPDRFWVLHCERSAIILRNSGSGRSRSRTRYGGKAGEVSGKTRLVCGKDVPQARYAIWMQLILSPSKHDPSLMSLTNFINDVYQVDCFVSVQRSFFSLRQSFCISSLRDCKDVKGWTKGCCSKEENMFFVPELRVKRSFSRDQASAS